MHLGWSSRVYPLDASELARVPDYDGPGIPKADLPGDDVILFVRPGQPDTILRGRSVIAARSSIAPYQSGQTVPTRIVFEPAIAKWNLVTLLTRFLRDRHKFESSGVYHIATSSLRRLGLERAIRTLDNPQRRGKVDRDAKMAKLEKSLRENGYDDSRPIKVMVCRSRGCDDSLRQGHHRISACLTCGIDRMAVRFVAAGALPRGLRRFVRKPPLRQDVKRCALEEALDLSIRKLVHLHRGRSSSNYIVVPATGHRFIAKLVSGRERAEKLAAFYTSVDSPLIPKLLFTQKPIAVGRRWLLAFEYKRGRHVPPERTTEAMIVEFAARYQELQRVISVEQPRIHGDLNHENYLWRGERLSGFLDFELVRPGAPAEDIVRLFVRRAERKHWRGPLFKFRLRGVFAALARQLPYTRESYRTALEAYASDKADRLSRKNRFSFLLPFKLNRQARIFQALRSSLAITAGLAPVILVPAVPTAAVAFDVAVLKTACGERSLVAWSQFGASALAMALLLALSILVRNGRACYLFLAGIFGSMALHELLRDVLDWERKGWAALLTAIPLVLGFLAPLLGKRTFALGLRQVCSEPGLRALPFGFVMIWIVSKICSIRAVWASFLQKPEAIRTVKHIVEEGTELFGYSIILFWAVSYFISRYLDWRENR